MAKADEPEAAVEKERSDRNTRRERQKTNGAARRSIPEPPVQASAPAPPAPPADSLVESAMRLVRKMTSIQRHEAYALRLTSSLFNFSHLGVVACDTLQPAGKIAKRVGSDRDPDRFPIRCIGQPTKLPRDQSKAILLPVHG